MQSLNDYCFEKNDILLEHIAACAKTLFALMVAVALAALVFNKS
jgi:hypothetical protein